MLYSERAFVLSASLATVYLAAVCSFSAAAQVSGGHSGSPSQSSPSYQPNAVLAPMAGSDNAGLEYALGNAAYLRQDYVDAVVGFSRSCQAGHAGGCFNLGAMFHNGQGVPESLTEAASWYRRSLDIDPANLVVSGNFQLVSGLISYRRGSFELAMSAWRVGCSVRNSMSCANVGTMYHNGQGVVQNLEEAIRWYNSALEIDASNRQAITNRDLAYRTRESVISDNVNRGAVGRVVPASIEQAQFIDQFLTRDSRYWISSRYDIGSVRNVTVNYVPNDRQRYSIRAEFTLDGGTQWWIIAEMEGDSVRCVTSKNSTQGCRPPYTPENQVPGFFDFLIRDLWATPSGSSSSSDGICVAMYSDGRFVGNDCR